MTQLIPSNDFIFGSLATDDLRLAHVRSLAGGVTHRSRRSPLDPLPGQPVELLLSAGPAFPGERAWVYWSTDGRDPAGERGRADHGFVAPMETAGEIWDVLVWGYVRAFRTILPAQPDGTVVRYRLTVETRSGLEIPADGGAFYAYSVDDDLLPEWSRDAVVYQIMPDRFHPGPGKSFLQPETPWGFYGGTFNGIAANLDYLSELGVNTIWLTPFFPSPSHHGYDASDYFEVEPRLGTKADFRHLVDETHARGMRLILDFVANHWSSAHPSFQSARSDPLSPYHHWYQWKSWPEDYESFFGVADLPAVNLRNPHARQSMLDAVHYWLDFGVDGYRLDYAIGPTADFWADFRRETRRARPDCWTFGEVVEPPPSQTAFHGLLDGCLDFNLLEAFRNTFAFQQWDAARLAGFLDRHEAHFPLNFSRPSFLDNHDMNRILWVLQGDKARLRLAALCQFTLIGPPVIYYGTEVGLSQERDVHQAGRGLPEESRLPMLWDDQQDADLLDFYRRLIALRRAEPALRRGLRRTLYADADLLAYERAYEGRSLAVVFNLGSQARLLALPGNWARLHFNVGLEPHIHSETGATILTLAPGSAAILANG
jgi:glycosidase